MSSQADSDPIGLIGLGLMGAALTERLLEHGYRVVVWNRTREKADPLIAKGAQWNDNPIGVCRRVIISLYTTEVVEAVLAKLEAGLHQGQVLIDTTTGEPRQTAELGRRLAARGVHYLDAPISGSSQQTRDGEAAVMVGGDRAAFEACADLWRVMGTKVFHVGPCGSAAQMKLISNLVGPRYHGPETRRMKSLMKQRKTTWFFPRSMIPSNIPWPHGKQSAACVLFAAMALGFAVRAQAAATRVVFPPDPSVLDLRRDFGAKGDGVADDTAALQAGIEASSNRGKGGGTKILFLPNGAYRITSNLVVKASVGPWVYGESRDGVVIRLADGVPTNITAVLRAHPNESKETSADFFMRNFRNLTFDVGNNPHADGVRWYGNNSGILKNVRITGVGRVGINSGWLGQNGPNLIQDALVEGSFETGVRCAWSWGQTLSRVTVRKARAVGVYVNATAVGIEDLVVEETPVALHNEYPNDWKWWGGVVALSGGLFTGNDNSQPAITNTSVLYARNVISRGFKQVLHSTTPGGNVAGTKLDEYLSHPVKKLFPDAPETALKLPIRPEPPTPWETNLSHWVCANDHGAKFGDNRDDTAALQSAIDAAAATGKTVVCLRGIGGGDPNWYNLDGEVRVHGSVRLIMGLGFGRVIGGDQGRFIVDDRSAPVVKFLHLQAFGGRPPVVENRSSTNTLVVESCDLKVLGAGGGDIFVTDCPSAIELRSPGQRLWARQLNPEGDSDVGLVQNRGGVLWALGVKHEGRGVRFFTDHGGQTEVLGLFNYAPSIAKNDPRPAFDVIDADFSAAAVREISFGDTYPVKARASRGEETHLEKGGGWIGWALFRGGAHSTATAFPGLPRLRISENHRLLVTAGGDFACTQTGDRLSITFGGKAVADYVFRDAKILRPYFCNLHAPGGIQITRNHPPIAGQDATDHDTMHPGLWLAFGDINGQDFWRNQGRIEHVGFLEPPRVEKGQFSFVAENRLQSTNGQTIGNQISRIALAAVPQGFLLSWQADFLPVAEELVFGDQEEMGLGVRVAAKITEKNGGGIVASSGAKTAKATWGKSFEWCDCSGELNGHRVGVTLMPDPANFRPSWFHNRDYGLMVANPFGRNAMNQGETSRIVVKKGDRLSLRFGVYLHATGSATEPDLADAYRSFISLNAPRSASDAQSDDGALFSVARRLPYSPIIRPAMLPGADGANINGPSLIRAPSWLPNRLGAYYLYFAHHGGKYIRLAYADRLEGPWKIYEPGTLQLKEATGCTGHIASPDVHVDEARREIRMYFHGPAKAGGGQKSFVAVSKDGLRFKASEEVLGQFYFRVFQWQDAWFAMAKGGLLYRSDDGLSRFVQGSNPFPGGEARDENANTPGPRHVALHRIGNELRVYYSNIGDAPERILRRRIQLTADWKNWSTAAPEEVLRPETEEEGVTLALKRSSAGASKDRENALRDPGIFVDADGRVFLLYSVAGESGIGIAELIAPP